MKTFIARFFLSAVCLCAVNAFADNNTLIANYPSTSGSYNKIVLAPQASTDVSCNANNVGLLTLYTDPLTGNQSLQICPGKNANPTTVPYPETCFNRFSNTNTFTPCPAGYKLASTPADQITTSTTGTTYKVWVSICCNTPTINGSTVNSTVLPN